MLEARLRQADILKKVLDAVKELVTDANFDCSEEGIKLQAMDNSHVALVSLHLQAVGFEEYRCDRNMSLGMSLASLQKIIKSAAADDEVTLRADESQDVLGLLFESKHNDRVGEYEMKLMDIDTEHLGIPDTVYDAEVTMPSTEFARIIRDLKELGESVKIEVTKEGIRFSADGDIGSAQVTLKPTTADRMDADDSEDEEEEDEEDEPEDDEEDDEKPVADKKPVIDKKPAVSSTQNTDDEDDDVVIKSEKAGEEAEDKKPTIVDDSEDEGPKPTKKKKQQPKKPASKKRKAPTTPQKSTKGKKGNDGKKKKGAEEAPSKITISLQQNVNLTFSIKYLSNFAKSTPLSDYVHLHMSNEVPLLVAYPFESGHMRYYLAPKLTSDD